MSMNETLSGQKIHVSSNWTAYAPLEPEDDLLSTSQMHIAADVISIGPRTVKASCVQAVLGQHDFQPMFGSRYGAQTFNKVVYVFVPVHADTACRGELGLGGDYQLQAWLNGKLVLENSEAKSWPPTFDEYRIAVDLNAGQNMLVVRLTGGKGSALLAVGGPGDLAPASFHSILTDPFFTDARWQSDQPRAMVRDKSAYAIANKLEMFIDDFLIDDMAGAVERRLAHPVRQEQVFIADEPWEESGANYFSIVQVKGNDKTQSSINLYYSARPKEDPTLTGQDQDESRRQFTCILQSTDGVNFTRPNLGMVNFDGSKANNILMRGTPCHNFSPFVDANPNTKPDEKFKAIAYHTKGKGLGAFVSHDGLNWRPMCEQRVITQGNFDSHNLAYWDANIDRYVCYYRDNTGGLRRIVRATSDDFIQWSQGLELTYTDKQAVQMYTNGIFNDPDAPHLYVGLANRFVPERTKVATHSEWGLNDTVLLSSRDGQHFDRWEEGFIRPDHHWQNWTDRNLYAAWGIVVTSEHEHSIYWTEHNRHPGMCLMRGVIRKQGYASLHAPGNAIGEVLTRPLVFTGSELLLNYATSAVGSVRVGLCDEAGRELADHAMQDSAVMYGNEFKQCVTWRGQSNISEFACRPVRLRLRLQDADVFALRFA